MGTGNKGFLNLRRAATLRVILLAAVCCLLSPKPAHAYIDPNSTGLVTQTIGPLLILGTAALAFLRKQISSAIHRLASLISRQ